MRLCALASGSSGNALLVEERETKILVDAGLSGKKICSALKEIEVDINDLDALVITHEHQDHVKGAGIISRRYDLPVYAREETWEAMEETVGRIAPENQHILDLNEEIGCLKVECFPTFHDAVDPVAYSFYGAEKKATVLTDTGKINQNLIEEMAEADLLALESNHDVEMLKVGPYPYQLKRRIMSSKGHLSNVQSGEALAKALNGQKKQVILAHLSRENNFPELAYQTVKNILHDFDLEIGEDLDLYLSRHNKPSKILEANK